jgi:hypothetical protein
MRKHSDLEKIKKYEHNWDGYNASPVCLKLIEEVENILDIIDRYSCNLQIPTISAGAESFIEINWRNVNSKKFLCLSVIKEDEAHNILNNEKIVLEYYMKYGENILAQGKCSTSNFNLIFGLLKEYETEV